MFLYPFTPVDSVKEEIRNEKNISAQEDPQKKRTRLYEENGYKKRPQGSCEKKSQGQKAPYLLIYFGSEKTAAVPALYCRSEVRMTSEA